MDTKHAMTGKVDLTLKSVLRIVRSLAGVGVFAAFAILLNSLFSSQVSQSANQAQQLGSPSPTLTPSGSQTDPAAWKVYKDSKLGYSVNYSPTWFDKGGQDSNWGTWRDFASLDVESPIRGLGSGMWLRVALLKRVNQEGFWNVIADEQYFNYLKNATVGEARTADPRYVITKLSDLTVDGYPAVKQVEETAPGAQTEYTYKVAIYILKGA